MQPVIPQIDGAKHGIRQVVVSLNASLAGTKHGWLYYQENLPSKFINDLANLVAPQRRFL